MASSPLLLVITGPSGVGKDSVLARMKELGCPYHFAVTATTRPQRPGEEKEAGYQFLRHLALAEFEAMLARGEFLENATVYGHRYGVPKGPIRDALAQGKDVVLRTDVQGARFIKSICPQAVTIFLAPPSWHELERRLRARATDKPEQLDLRLGIARQEMDVAPEFDYTVVNDSLDNAVAAIERIIAAEKAKPR